MINFADIQVAYNNLYKQVRKYLWDFQAVEALADLEIACYRTCQDLQEISSALNRFVTYTLEVRREDADLDKAINDLQSLIDSDTSTYAKLNRVNEVISQ